MSLLTLTGGTITITNASTAVTGTGTAFNQAYAGCLLVQGGQVAVIESVESATGLTLAKAWGASTATDTAAYVIVVVPSTAGTAGIVLEQVNTLLAALDISGKVFAASGAPSDTLGVDADIYINTANGDLYVKASGTWGSAAASLQGPQGDPGNDGADGTDGATILTGTAAPDDGNGADDDIYIRTSTGDLYVKASGTWGSPAANLTGPQGDQGDPGDTGATGATGPSGTSALTRVRLVAPGNVDIATELEAGDTLDGETLVASDLVLLPAQSAAAENGVYVVPASGAASRHGDFDAYDELPGTYFSVVEGTAGASTLWRCTSPRGGTIDTTAVAIEEFAVSANVIPSIETVANGATIPALDGVLFVMSGATAVLPDPTSLPAGFSLFVRSEGSGATFRASYIDPDNASRPIYFNGRTRVGLTRFYMAPHEAIRFVWDGTNWQAFAVANGITFRQRTSYTADLTLYGSPTSWTAVPIDTWTNTLNTVQAITIGVAGLYAVNMQMYWSAPDGLYAGYVGAVINGSQDIYPDFYYSTLPTGNSEIASLTFSQRFDQGDTVNAEFFASSGSMLHQPAGAPVTVDYLGR